MDARAGSLWHNESGPVWSQQFWVGTCGRGQDLGPEVEVDCGGDGHGVPVRSHDGDVGGPVVRRAVEVGSVVIRVVVSPGVINQVSRIFCPAGTRHVLHNIPSKQIIPRQPRHSCNKPNEIRDFFIKRIAEITPGSVGPLESLHESVIEDGVGLLLQGPEGVDDVDDGGEDGTAGGGRNTEQSQRVGPQSSRDGLEPLRLVGGEVLGCDDPAWCKKSS